MHSPPTSTEDDIPANKEQQQLQRESKSDIVGGRNDTNIDMERGVTPRPEEYEYGNEDDDDAKGSLALIYDTYRPWFQLSLLLQAQKVNMPHAHSCFLLQ
ncbi:predicted protein [Lichtheimia corymbifera JMRC:FSU:9682]|uniref:Uncharacterized protein n=1 Tax=Lichtheimia corymbifera JMRC:FSU:9682 TaxID=1263082 RepID=A0A068RT07_9FUNG|nr:predicted protein [Lichtheimia corymbifera JMRC:FSU:9682]